jgi:hypothetical protein
MSFSLSSIVASGSSSQDRFVQQIESNNNNEWEELR